MASPAVANRVQNWHVGKDLGSDHFPVYCELISTRRRVENPTAVHGLYNIKKANWKSFKEAISRTQNHECSVEAIEEALRKAADESIPKKKPSGNSNHINSWWTEEISTLRRERQRARKRWKLKRTTTHRIYYNKCNAVLRKAILVAKRKSWREFVSSMNPNTPSSAVWRRFRAIEGATGKKIEQIKLPSGVWLEEDSEKAEAFNNFYKQKAGKKISWPKTLTRLEMSLTANFEMCFTKKDPANQMFTMSELKNGMDQLVSAAPGMDNIYTEMLQNCL